ncbi:putative aTP synthase protein I [Escherichia coli p0305293.8]|nr:putative aTP synthase protein I [Escherichia coli p0305293.8]
MIFAWRHQAHTPAKGRVGLDIRIWRSFQSSGDVGVTGGGVGGFKGGILAADRYVGFGAGGSDTGTGCN